jgi:hypothetical protein
MKKIKKLIVSVSFQIGVNIIGLPVTIKHDLSKSIVTSSKFHR